MIAIIIPAYQPSKEMTDFIEQLKKHTSSPIFVIDDGSGESYKDFFNRAVELGCHLVTHEANQGKGAAIKSGLLAASQTYEKITSFLTCDADGQHVVSDVLMMIETAKEKPDVLLLGTRTFKEKNVPFKSRLGNFFSTIYFYLSTGFYCPDTQTGLRVIPIELLYDALHLKENRYDYEMAFLTHEVKVHTEIEFVPVQTIYINQNENSHFRPVVDSALIFKQPLKFLATSLSSAAIDILMFWLLVHMVSDGLFEAVAIASILARLISGLYNFTMNRIWSFESRHPIKHQLPKYITVYLLQLGTSILLVTALTHLFLTALAAKLIVDSLLFVVSYRIQKHWVFKKHHEHLTS